MTQSLGVRRNGMRDAPAYLIAGRLECSFRNHAYGLTTGTCLIRDFRSPDLPRWSGLDDPKNVKYTDGRVVFSGRGGARGD